MSKIIWDAIGERKYETGCDHGVLYPAKKGFYPAGVAWNGLTSINENPGGADATDLWADNIKYGTMRAAETYGFTIEAYTIPDEFRECDGSKEIVPGVYAGQQSRNPFGMSYRTAIGSDTSNDYEANYTIHLIWGATASPSGKDHGTINESPDAVTMSWECETTPPGTTTPGFKPMATMELNSTVLTAEKLKTIEEALYGTEDSEAWLPTPDQIIAFVKDGTTMTPPSV